jgi:predicted Fe-Mo cluster-binding NifX family protein
MTKVCVTSSGTTLEAMVDPRFGRCAYFLVVDTDTMAYEALPNEAVNASGGAGIQAAQTVAARGVEVLITGTVGPNAYTALTSSGIRILSTQPTKVEEVLKAFKAGALTGVSTPGPAHVGMGRGMGRGGGRGRGGGSGGGRGRGGSW